MQKFKKISLLAILLLSFQSSYTVEESFWLPSHLPENIAINAGMLSMLLLYGALQYSPSLIAGDAGFRRERLEKEVADFKVGLSKEELTLFDQYYKPDSTVFLTKAPLSMQFVHAFAAPVNSFDSSLWYSALSVAMLTQYLECLNRQKFEKAVQMIKEQRKIDQEL